ncbi:hypothetical protein B0H13DRAFT_2356636 [Mycena leptocephala]|nr:hypothetical protein B0H13DRAFT_2356636 [Mycena leptocephala]
MSRSNESREIDRLRRLKRNLVFLDLEAQASDEDERDEDDDDSDDLAGLADFIDERAFPEVLGERRVHLALMDDTGPSPEAEAEAIIARHRLRLQQQRELGQDEDYWKSAWDPLSLPDYTDSRIWRLKVKIGHEYDVVCTCAKMIRSTTNIGRVKSVSAPTCTTGYVYIEADGLDVVNYLKDRVAFVYRLFSPQQVPLEDYTTLFSTKDPSLLHSNTWARVKRKGPYCGDLVWIQAASEYECSYEVWLLPRCVFVPDEMGRSPPPDEYYLLTGGTTTWEKGLFYKGLLVQRGIPLYVILEDDARPTLQELEEFRCSKAVAECAESSRSSALAAAVHEFLPLVAAESLAQPGDRVRVTTGPFMGLRGSVSACGPRTVDVILDDSRIASSTLDRSAVIIEFEVGNLVQISWGEHRGLKGWVVSIDWDKRIAGVMIHTYMPFTNPTSSVPMPEEVNVREYDVQLAFLTTTTLNVTMPRPSVVIPRTSDARSEKFTPAPSNLVNLEVRISYGHLRGTYGTIQSVLAVGDKVKVRTEGLAVNLTVECDSTKLRERHTNLLLAEYVTASESARTEARKHRQRVWAESINPALTEAGFLASVDMSETWDEIGPTAQDLWPDRFGPTVPSNSSTSNPTPPTSSPPVPNVTRPPPLLDTTRTDVTYGLPSGQLPGVWLTQPQLRGLTLDVIIRNAERAHGGKYNNQIGLLNVPRDKLITLGNRNNSLDVTISKSMGTNRTFKLWHIFPLSTTEFEGHVSVEDALPVVNVFGTYVAVIGPDDGGSLQWVGKIGVVGHGQSINVEEHVLSFPESSLCRSDPFPRRKTEARVLLPPTGYD